MTRLYPLCCTSGYCGKMVCEGCRNLELLRDFQNWVIESEAIKIDPIWCPRVWTSDKY